MLENQPKEMVSHIISYLPNHDWVNCQLSGKLFHVSLESEIKERKSIAEIIKSSRTAIRLVDKIKSSRESTIFMTVIRNAYNPLLRKERHYNIKDEELYDVAL